MGVTTIKKVVNEHKTLAIHVTNNENPNDTGGPGHSIRIPAGETWVHDMWIPWCTDQNQFPTHTIYIRTEITVNDQGSKGFYIWQANMHDGDFVRYTTDNFYQWDNHVVPGNHAVNGDRVLKIQGTNSADASIYFE